MRIGRRDVAVENKALILLRAEPTATRSLVEECKQLAVVLIRRMEPGSATVDVMARLPRDPFALVSKLPGYDVTVELRADAALDTFGHVIGGVSGHLRSAGATASDTVVLLGRDHLFRPCAAQPVRFQYLMRRRPDLDHEAFARHYRERHSQFGFKTLGVSGYAQLHVDPDTSAAALRSSGLGGCDVDGVSQLSMPTLTKFLFWSPINASRGMVGDEKHFVDRANSIMFSSKVVASFR